MKKYAIVVFALMVSGLSGYAQGYQQLFNGKDLTGWIIHGTEKWYVENGELVGESGPDQGFGYLATDRNYKDFIMDMYFKMDAGGNSGVFIRSAIEGVIIEGWQIEIDGKRRTGDVFESYGRGWLTNKGGPSKLSEEMFKTDDWNYLRLYVQGDKVSTWLNGRNIANAVDAAIGAANGFVALQIHHGGGVKVRWKNIRIKELVN